MARGPRGGRSGHVVADPGSHREHDPDHEYPVVVHDPQHDTDTDTDTDTDHDHEHDSDDAPQHDTVVDHGPRDDTDIRDAQREPQL
ncbi:MAG: hypothetical protein ACR2LI_14085 [Propionibacteriaceae bacterium]